VIAGTWRKAQLPKSDEERVRLAWDALSQVEDPELPALSIVDLGMVRHVTAVGTPVAGVIEVGLTTTYSGCPATEVIRLAVENALRDAAVGEFRVKMVLAPAWTTDWITEDGHRKLAAYGIVPPTRSVGRKLPLACPRCRSIDTQVVSEFGSTPCKSLHRCHACLEPFEQFKCL
jgi:ring-1,2-phenylacetyl-CoA epoxidase subunit PaaD